MRNISDLDQLALVFFREFSRSEHALKAAGFHNGNGNAKADWTMFAEQVENLIRAPDSVELSKAIHFVFTHPPKKQVIRDGRLRWDDARPGQILTADTLLVYVRRVRNNLFHGGKFNANWFEPERSEQLIQNCLIILKACVCQLESTRGAYHG